MSGRPPFDFERAAFWLVAGVIAVYGVVVLAGVVVCAIYFEWIVEGKWVCDKDSRLAELLGAALAAALAFAGRRNRDHRNDNDKGDQP